MVQQREVETAPAHGLGSLMSDLIEVNSVTFAYRKPKTNIFRELSLSFKDGQITCILGHNGAGKTTLLKLLYGILRQQAGQIRIDRNRVPSYRHIFFLSDRFGINQELSLRQNLIFRCQLFRVDVDAVLSHSYIRDYKLLKHLDTPTGKLSAGYFTRANIVAGLVFGPSLLMLDEPTNSIDPATRELLMHTLRQQRESGVSVLLVTHDLDFAYAVGDRLLVIDEGEIVVDDSQPRTSDLEDFRQRYVHFTEQKE